MTEDAVPLGGDERESAYGAEPPPIVVGVPEDYDEAEEKAFYRGVSEGLALVGQMALAWSNQALAEEDEEDGDECDECGARRVHEMGTEEPVCPRCDV